MAYERSKFGDGKVAGTSGSNVTMDVHNHYGPRDIGGTQGVTRTAGFMNELTIDLDYTMLENEQFPLLAPGIPALSKVEDVFLEVEEEFDITGTGATVSVGTAGTEATNGLEITSAQLGAVGMYDLTSTLGGTWAAGLVGATVVGISTDSVTDIAAEGKARLIIRYIKA